MSPMSDQPLTLAVLAQFHREIILPDVRRIVHEAVSDAVSASERRLHGHIDGILHKLDKLETEYESLKVGLRRVETQGVAIEALHRDLLAAVNRLEERLSRVEHQVDSLVEATQKDPLRAELIDLRARVDSLEAQVRSLESRRDQ